MENPVKKSRPNRFQRCVHYLNGIWNPGYRNQRIHQAETMRIMDRISEIKERHPELIKYLNEMPEFPMNVNDSKIKLADLMNYNNSLLELLEKYDLEAADDLETIYYIQGGL